MGRFNINQKSRYKGENGSLKSLILVLLNKSLRGVLSVKELLRICKTSWVERS